MTAHISEDRKKELAKKYKLGELGNTDVDIDVRINERVRFRASERLALFMAADINRRLRGRSQTRELFEVIAANIDQHLQQQLRGISEDAPTG